MRTAVALELSPGLMWAAGRLGLRDLAVPLEELASCFRQKWPSRMPTTWIGPRAGGPGLECGTYTTSRSTTSSNPALDANVHSGTQGGPGPIRPGAGQSHPSSGEYLSDSPPSRGGDSEATRHEGPQCHSGTSPAGGPALDCGAAVLTT